jgi:glycopeptide antibiotics resistance protein
MPPRFLYPFLPYRSLFVPVLVAAAIGVPCWLAFRLYRHRSRGQPMSFGRELLLLIFVAYLSGLAAVTLLPSRSSRAKVEATDGITLRPNLTSLTCSFASSPSGSTAPAFCERNAKGNFVLFIPLGILLPLIWRRLRFRDGMAIAIALSVSIEILQYLSRSFGSKRLADVNDVILNVLGAALGLAFVALLRWRPGSRAAVSRA